jgi:hypothetical protein
MQHSWTVTEVMADNARDHQRSQLHELPSQLHAHDAQLRPDEEATRSLAHLLHAIDELPEDLEITIDQEINNA